MINRLLEGGNVFKDAQGQPLTQRINQADIPPTIKWLESVTGLDLSGEKDPATGYPQRWLGSTGKKPSSGDLDLAVNSTEISKPQLKAQLDQYITKMGQDPRGWVRLSGEAVHLKTPIAGDPKKGFVQTDFMLMPDLNWGTFWLGGGAGSDYKGMYRNVLMSSVAKALGLKASAKGIISRATENVVTMDPDQAAKILLGPKATVKDLATVENIYAALTKDPDREAKLKDFREYLARDGLQEPGQVQESDVSFIARLRDRIVNQGMQVIVEGVRIEHPEDLVFDMGSQGLTQALNGIVAAASNPNTATVKWDGKPAIIFGRKPTGEFVLTDKSGFLAKGYDGLATSPEQIEQIMGMRSGERGELVALYKRLFPLLRAAVPQSFRGYIQGDLLYSQRPQAVDGNWVFQPNTVKYSVPINSELGQKIGNSVAGVVIHTSLEAPGAAPQPIRAADLNDVQGLLILDPSLRESRSIKLNAATIKDVKSIVSKYGRAIDQMFNPEALRQRKISNLPALIKTYINSRVRSGGFDNLIGGFGQWVQQKEPAKAPRIFEWANANKQAMAALFQAFLDISSLKNELVRQLDSQGHAVQASINDEPGHEGYVGHNMKFVDRMRFSQANFARNNPNLG